ncbi:MAG: PAS domain-containing protein [Minwuia sp.]|uniref:PAS domain-containing protein n=1 Tax=Minwuia sp. TaxID=2493630 RepID=UPI003A843302
MNAAQPSGTLKRLNLSARPEGFPESAAITGIHDLWQSRLRDGLLPARRDFLPEDFRPWLGHVSLVDVEGRPPRFRWRLIGTSIARQMGRDVSGFWFHDIYDDGIREDYDAKFATAVDTRAPAYFAGDLEFVGREFRSFRSVHLPLAANGRDVDTLLLLLDFD